MIIIFRRQEIPIPDESVKHGPISTGMDEQFVYPLEGASIALTEKVHTHATHQFPFFVIVIVFVNKYSMFVLCTM